MFASMSIIRPSIRTSSPLAIGSTSNDVKNSTIILRPRFNGETITENETSPPFPRICFTHSGQFLTSLIIQIRNENSIQN